MESGRSTYSQYVRFECPDNIFIFKKGLILEKTFFEFFFIIGLDHKSDYSECLSVCVLSVCPHPLCQLKSFLVGGAQSEYSVCPLSLQFQVLGFTVFSRDSDLTNSVVVEGCGYVKSRVWLC